MSSGCSIPSARDHHWGKRKLKRDLLIVLVYVNTSKQVGGPEQLKVFATADAATNWFEEHAPEGVAFEDEVIGP
jgi:hypothetical protein